MQCLKISQFKQVYFKIKISFFFGTIKNMLVKYTAISINMNNVKIKQ